MLTLSDFVAWTFNIRGSDIPHTPVRARLRDRARQPASRSCSSPPRSSSRRCAPTSKRSPRSRPGRALADRLKALRTAGKRVRLDPNTAGYCVRPRARRRASASRAAPIPSLALKAVKNAAEIKGARAAHVRDGARRHPLSRLARRRGRRPGALDEIEAVRQLEGFRRATNQLREISFDTISGSGPNGAIVHYRVSEATNRKLRGGELFLIDSGAQYLDGTTDITRTVAIGKPTDEMRERFTLVLKGHIAIASGALSPRARAASTSIRCARRALWQHGLDYDHGTGHGVGSYLSVHEGPQSISRAGMAVLEPGMICSNEPGYYKEGAYGIRIENLVLVTELQKLPGGDREMMGFETLTLAPIDRRLIVKAHADDRRDRPGSTPTTRASLPDGRARGRRRDAAPGSKPPPPRSEHRRGAPGACCLNVSSSGLSRGPTRTLAPM